MREALTPTLSREREREPKTPGGIPAELGRSGKKP